MRRAIIPATLALASMLSCAASCAASSGQSATKTIEFMGTPILEVVATMSSKPASRWQDDSIDLKIKVLVDLPGSRLAEDASSIMSKEYGLDASKAQAFEGAAAKALGKLAKGAQLDARCAPGQPLVFASSGASSNVGDAETARAFCAMWLAPSGEGDLRGQLGLR